MRPVGDLWARFRARHPSLPPQHVVDRVKPTAWAALDIAGARRGARVAVAGRWPLRVEIHRRLKMDFRTWEREFVNAMMPNLRHDDVVYDIGAEFGEWGALAATICGGDRVHLFEPNAPAWRCIRRLWAMNSLAPPGGCWRGFVSDASTEPLPDAGSLSQWPAVSSRGIVKFESLRDTGEIPCIAIDEYAQITGRAPTVILMDIEGAEGLALEGAMETLNRHRPSVFVSVHPTRLPRFGSSTMAIHNRFAALNYSSRLLATDHEEHWVFWDEDKRSLVSEPDQAAR